MIPLDTIIQGDCLEEMKKLPDGCIDLILCDLPYGTTACKWDHVIPFEPLWKEYKRLIKDRGAIVLTASQPFTSFLITSNIEMFKYCWVWDKNFGANYMKAQYMPILSHEDICIFSHGKVNRTGNRMMYNPQKEPRETTRKWLQNGYTKNIKNPKTDNFKTNPICEKESDFRYPKSVINISNSDHTNRLHPTQKPVALFEYLIKTYTNEGDLVLDNCIGSGTTAVAAKRTGRHFIGIELSSEYCEIARKRVAAVPARLDRWAEAGG
jgi:site-specific DNA-methyltransferase (adenine-specific)